MGDAKLQALPAIGFIWLSVVVISVQYEHAPLRVRCTMLRKHPPVDPVLSCLSCFRKPSVGVCQVISNSADPGIAWPSTRFRPDLWRWFEEDTASIRRLIHSGYMAKQREETGLDNRGKWRLLSGMTDIFIPHEICCWLREIFVWSPAACCWSELINTLLTVTSFAVLCVRYRANNRSVIACNVSSGAL